jgi:uncharacterized protein with beta-barrel porin domain
VSRRRRRLRALLLAGTMLSCAVSPALAQTWGGPGSTTSTTNYNLGTNWDTGVAPVTPASGAFFTNTGSATVVVTAAIAPDHWTFGPSSQSYVISGAAVTFGVASFSLNNNAISGQVITISNDMTGSTLTNNGTLVLSGNNTFGITRNIGTLTNNGTMNGAVQSGGLSAPGAVFNNSGTVTSIGTTFGSINLTSTSVVGSLGNNQGSVNAQGQITNTISNEGVFTVVGTLTGGASLNNIPGGQFFVSGGNATVGQVSNGDNFDAALIQVSAGRTLTATSVTNTAVATIDNLGTLTATTITNNQFALFNTNAATSVINGSLTNFGTVNAAGQINGAISNTGIGVFTVTGDLAVNNTFTNDVVARLLVSGGNLTGITTLDNKSTNTGGVSISAGRTLSANIITNEAGATINDSGTLTALTSFANSGTVTGAGTIIGNLANNSGGTFAPGNGTPGSAMTVTGNLSFASASTYSIQVDSTSASRANVSGTATPNGATVNVNYLSGTLQAQYTILHANAAVSGTFNPTVVSNNSNINSTLTYNGNNVFLNTNLNFTPPPGPGGGGGGGSLSVNQQNVANAIVNFFNANGSIPLAFTALTPAGLTQVSGEGATASQQTTFDAMSQFMGLLTDPFISGRGDPVSAGGSPTAYADQTLSYAAKRQIDAFAMFTKAPPQTFAQRWSVWAAGFGGSQRTDGNAMLGSNDTRSSLSGTAVGADYRLSPNTLAGFALAGGGTNFSVNTLGSGRSDLFQAGAFVRHNIGPAYITGALAYGWQDITTDRIVTVAGLDHLRAEFNANAWSGRVEGGYRFVVYGFGITPYAAGQFVTFDLPAYMEQAIQGANTFALGYNAKSVTDGRSELGIRTDKSFATTNGIFTLRGRLAWAHDFDPGRNLLATFQTLPGASFVVNGAKHAADSALTTASAEWKWINGWSAAATFEGEVSNVSHSYAGKGAVRYAW